MAGRCHNKLDVGSVLDLIHNTDSESDFEDDSDDDDVPLARLVRRDDSDMELSQADLEDDFDGAPDLVLPGDVYDDDNDGWSASIGDRNDANIRFRNSPGLAAETVTSLGGPDALKDATPADIFGLFFTDNLIEEIVEQTNLYARQERERTPDKHKSKWWNTNVTEMKSWFGLLFSMGLVEKGNLRDYWTTSWLTETPGVRKVMPRDRFVNILRYLHFVDNETAVVNKDDPQYDKLFKVRPVLDDVVNRCKTVYRPEREIAIDESMIACKSRFGFKQFMKDKPIRWGLKLFMVSDSKSGYILNFTVYTGKERDATDKGATHDVVMRVSEPFLNLGHHLYMDNYYTSIPVFEELLRHATPACGTVRVNRKGLPKDSMNMKGLLVKNLKRGNSLHRYKGSLTAVTWKDNKAVTCLTSLPLQEEYDTVQRKAKVAGKWEKIDVNRPLVITNYNTFMGGVDLSDQRINSHKRLMRGVVWYLKLFWYILDVARVNSLLVSELCTGKRFKMKDFTLRLAKELISITTQQQLGRPSLLPESIRTNRALDHAPTITADRKRGPCVVHKQRVDTPYSCSVCRVRMCPAPCFQRYHYMKDFAFLDPDRPDKPKYGKKGKN